MATILLAWELGAGTGHCVNLLPLAQEFTQHGHKVVLAARDLAAAKNVFGDTEVSYVQAPFQLGGWSGNVDQTETFAHILHNTGFGDDVHVQVLTDAWANLLDMVEPDAVVCEHAPHALLASHVKGVSRYVMGTGFFVPPHVAPLPNVRPGASDSVSNDAAACEQAVLDRVNAYLETYDKRRLGQLSQLYSDADGRFLLTLPELDHYSQRNVGTRPADATFIRSWSPTGGLTPAWPEGDGPRVFGYLQPASRNWRPTDLLVLLAELRIRSVVYIPGGDESLVERSSSSPVKIVTQRIDIQHAAQQADIAILNGNAGTATEMLLAGVPQLNIPLHLEQAVFSQRIVELGVGLMARPDRSPQIAARLMSLLSNTEFKVNAQEFAKRYAESPLPSSSSIAETIGKTFLR